MGVMSPGMISNEEPEGRGEFLGLWDDCSEKGRGLGDVSDPELNLSLGGSGAALFLEDLILDRESLDP